MIVSSQVAQFQAQTARVLQLFLEERFSAGDTLDVSLGPIAQKHEALAVQLREGHVENIFLFGLIYLVTVLDLLQLGFIAFLISALHGLNEFINQR